MSVALNPICNGRVVLGGQVRNITLPPAEWHTFDFSRYIHILPDEGKLLNCRSAASERITHYPPHDREADLFWSRAVGYETGSVADSAENEYRRISRSFDILAGAAYFYQHPALESVVQQLGLSRLTPFYLPPNFDLAATGESVPMEVDQMRGATGRTATFEATATINEQPYLLEVKGVNYADGPIMPHLQYLGAGECAGGLAVGSMEQSVEMLRYLNENGYDSVILLAAYTIPGLHQFDGKRLGAYVRAVRSSPPVSHYHDNLKDVADSLGMERLDLAEHIIRSAARDAARMWKLGVVHCWIHEQNIRIDGLSDLSGARYVSRTGFRGMVRDAEMLVASSQKIMRRLLGPDIVWPPLELAENDPEEFRRLEAIGEERKYEDQAAHDCSTREIITGELNRHLDLSLPPIVGTTTLAAMVYDRQRQLGLTRKAETIEIDHWISSREIESLSLKDLRNI